MANDFRLFILVAWLATALSGCSDLGTQPKRLAAPQLSATSLDFGTVAVSDSAFRSFTLSNTGTANLTGSASLSCPEYELDSGGGPFTIPPGGSVTLVVQFKPGALGTFACTLDLGPNVPQVSVAGAGALQAPGAAGTTAPDSLDFGVLQAGQTSTRTFRIFSVGTAPLLVNVVSTCGAFTILSGGGPATLDPAGSLTVTVQFAPLAGGAQPCGISVGPGVPDVGVTGFATTVSFASDVQPILENWCLLGCHDHFTGSYAGLLQTPSAYPAPARIIVPFDPAHSTLYGKISNTGQYGQLMPQGGPMLPQADRDLIRDWILEGARNN